MQIKCLTPKECGMKLKEPVYEKCFNCSSFRYNANSTNITPRHYFSSELQPDTISGIKSDNLADRKNDGKLRWRNFPMFLLKPLMEVAQYGEGKYDMYNFLKGGSQNQYLDCMKRHLEKYESPFEDDIDDESKVSHLAHVAWNALVAIYMLEHRPELDDRFKINK